MKAQSEQIRGQVARVLSDREVALNIGREQNVEVGMLFDIMVPDDLEITDPCTGDSLGRIDRVKVKTRVKVSRVEDKFCIARTYRMERVNVGGADVLPRLRGDLDLPRWITHVERIRTHEIPSDGLTESERYVATGDPVLQVLDDHTNLSDAFVDILEGQRGAVR